MKMILLFSFLFTTCFPFSENQLVDKSKLLGNDYRLFQETPVWSLAKAVRDEDTSLIKKIVMEEKVNIDYLEERFGSSLLMLTVLNEQYNSCKTLLELGADPNKHDTYDGSSAMIESAKVNGITDDNTKFLKLLLAFKGNANDVEVGERRDGNTNRNTPLIASQQVNGVCSSLPKVKLLVEAGADIHYKNEFGITVLWEAFILDNYDVVLYLLNLGADYNQLIVDRSEFSADGKKMYMADMLREDLLPLDSKEYKLKMEIVAFLKEKGIDYRNVPVPDFILKEIKETYPGNWKEYLEKY